MICSDGLACREGACTVDPCAGIACEAEMRCLDGTCVYSDCSGIVCPPGQVCGFGPGNIPQCFSTEPEDRPGIDPNAGDEGGNGGGNGGQPDVGPGPGVLGPNTSDMSVVAIPDGGFDNKGDGDQAASGCDACTVRGGASEPWVLAALAGLGVIVRRRRRR